MRFTTVNDKKKKKIIANYEYLFCKSNVSLMIIRVRFCLSANNTRIEYKKSLKNWYSRSCCTKKYIYKSNPAFFIPSYYNEVVQLYMRLLFIDCSDSFRSPDFDGYGRFAVHVVVFTNNMKILMTCHASVIFYFGSKIEYSSV